MNSSIVIAVIAIITVAGVGGGAFVLMGGNGDQSPTYTITYDLDGATGTAPVQNALSEGEKFTLATCEASKLGHEFCGWSDGVDTYTAGSTYTVAAKNVVLKALWQLSTYTINAPQSSTGYQVTAQDATINYNESYTFTVTIPDEKYSGQITVTADGTHGTITQITEGNSTTVTIPEITSNISSITLDGITELGRGTHFDYLISGTWSYSSMNGIIEGSTVYKYEAQNEEDMIFTERSVLTIKQGETVISSKDTTEEPTCYLGDLNAADYFYDLTDLTPAGTATILTTDGQKTLNKYTSVDDGLTKFYYVDPVSNIMYKVTVDGTKNSMALSYSYELNVYEILRESPYVPSEKITQKAVMAVAGTHATRDLGGSITYSYYAEGIDCHINKVDMNVIYTDDSSAALVGNSLSLSSNEDNPGMDVPLGAIRGDDVVLMTIHGEKTLQVWSYTKDGWDNTAYYGQHDGKDVLYKGEMNSSLLNMTLILSLTEVILVD